MRLVVDVDFAPGRKKLKDLGSIEKVAASAIAMLCEGDSDDDMNNTSCGLDVSQVHVVPLALRHLGNERQECLTKNVDYAFEKCIDVGYI